MLKAMTKQNIISFAALCASLFFTSPAHADRVVKFYGSGDNAEIYGLYKTAPTASTCKITINNQSGQTEKYKLTVTAITSQLTAGVVQSYNSVTPNPTTDSVGGNIAAAINTSFVTINDGLSHNYVFTYNALPATTVTSQHVECNGTITIQDAAAGSPGSLGFSGIINTFTEEQTSSGLSTTNAKATGSSPMPGFVPLNTNQN